VATFEQYCLENSAIVDNKRVAKEAFIVFADEVRFAADDKYLSNPLLPAFYQNCGEDDIKMELGRMDPVLRLYPGCPLMMTQNHDVPKGEANGTTAECNRLFLKHGEMPTFTRLKIGSEYVHVQSCRACQVDHIELRHCNDRIQPNIFKLKPETYTFQATLSMPAMLNDTAAISTKAKMRAVQLPLVSNTATTGHKLQGATIVDLFVHAWNYTCPNWVYVTLSRVRTMDGLIFRKPIKRSPEAFKVPSQLVIFLERMRSKTAALNTHTMTDVQLRQHFGYDS
jgi:hypothetical protein